VAEKEPDRRKTIPASPQRDAFSALLARRLSRRAFLRHSAALGAASLVAGPLAGCAPGGARSGPFSMGFEPIAVSAEDAVRVPPGYSARVLFAWGDPVGHPSGSPAFRSDAGNSAAEQALQAGMHHDGMHYFPLRPGSNASDHGLLAINHEYADDGLLHPDGTANWSAGKTLKSQNAHGVSVIEVRAADGAWSLVRPSRYARRITARTPMRISGPAAGAPAMRTAADPDGVSVLGTFGNCAHGHTPWGTYLACEENFQFYFARGSTPDHRRYGIASGAGTSLWHGFDARFDCAQHPNEPNRFGWVVEIDPYDASSMPVKRTALGRFCREGAQLSLTADGHIVLYSGDDAAFEYVYKFVSRDRYDPRRRAAARDLLDHGTLYAARFRDDGTGEWLALVHGEGPLVAANGFRDQAEVLVRTRQSADAVGATRMDRPEWIAVHPVSREVYCTLTNNAGRGRSGSPGPDAANPRADNVFGHIIRWRETGGDPAATRFDWDVFALCGDPLHPEAARRGNVKGDAFGSPDGLWFDARGLLWIQTDVSTSTQNRGHYERLGNNQMLCADVTTGTVRRFLTGPRGCEITGAHLAPDQRTMFVNIQHPGETPRERSDPKNPKAVSRWPDGDAGGRPRSATIVIRRDDGEPIGS